MNLNFIILTICLFVANLHGQKTIQGVVLDGESKLPIQEVLIHNKTTSNSTYSNEIGAFEIVINDITDSLLFHQIGYEDLNIPASLVPSEIYLKPAFLDEVTVSGVSSFQNDKSGMISLNKSIISALPTIGGEIDFISSLVIFPSVSKGEEISKGISVRGGSIDQNVMHINGIQSTNTGHLFNLFSAVPSVAIDELNLHSGGIPAYFGNAISSGLGVKLLKPKENILKLDLGASNSKISFQTPFGKSKKSSIIFSGRTSYLDLLRKKAYDKTLNNYQLSNGENGYYFGYTFYDYLLSTNLYLGNELNLNIFGLYSYDKNTYIFNQSYLTYLKHDLYNLTLGAVLTKTWSKDRQLDFRIGYNNNAVHRFEKTLNFTSNQWTQEDIINHEYGVGNWTSRIDYKFKVRNINLQTGLFAYKKIYNPGTSSLLKTSYDIDLRETNSEFINRDNDAFNINTGGFYIQSDFNPTEKLQMSLGLRNSAYLSYPKTHFAIEPRMSARYKLNNRTHLRGSFDYLTQFDHGLVLSEVGLDNIITLPSLDVFQPAKSLNYSLGFVKKMMDHKLIFATDVFYKDQWNLQRLALAGKDNIVSDTLTELIAKNGTGFAYGVETQITYQGKNFIVNGSYTFGHSKRKYTNFNNGVAFPFGYDKPHEFNTSIVYGIGKRTSVSLNFTLSNGSRYTLPTGKIYNTSGESILIYNGQENENHLPLYHRLDFAYEYNIPINQYWKSKISLNVINLYNKRNINFIEILDEENYKIEGVSYIPILPSINIKFQRKSND